MRALYKNANIFILDEPTSAIDPVSEYEYYKMFHKDTIGKTVIYITHRMASAKFADFIVVMDKGEIAEMGCFDELIKSNGLFAKAFELQAEYYEK